MLIDFVAVLDPKRESCDPVIRAVRGDVGGMSVAEGLELLIKVLFSSHKL